MASSPLVELSPMDAVMGNFGLAMLYLFPAADQAFDLDKLHDSFCALIDQDYALFLGKLEVDAATGVIGVRHRDGRARELISFAKERSETLSTQQVMDMRPMTLMPSREAQLITAKGTLLNDGGLAIGINLSHTLLDGQGVFTFMAAWGAHYRDVPLDQRAVISHDRQLLGASGVGAECPHPEFRIPAPAASISAGAPPAPESEMPSCTQQFFRLSREELQKLKALAFSGCSEHVPFVSTLDAVTALFTILITQARAPSWAEIRVTTGVNARTRLDPPLPSTYAGNAIFNALSTYSTADLLAAPVTAETLSQVAQRIRASIRERDNAFLRDAVEFVAQQSNWAAIQVGTDFFFGPDLMFTSWANMGQYDADFGSKPWFVGPPWLPVCDGMTVLMEGRQGADAIDVLVLLESQTLDRLRALYDQTRAFLLA